MRSKLVSIVFAAFAALAFAALLVIPPATRLTVLDLSGRVVYDTDGAAESHADRVEFRAALAGKAGAVIRPSQTTHTELLYSARRCGNYVLRLAIPCDGLLAPILMARFGFLVAGVLGALMAFLVLRFRRRIDAAKANEQFRREFTANVTHELRTPLTSILGAAEMLGDGSSLTEAEKGELVAIIGEQTARLSALSKDVLSLAQLERSEDERHVEFESVGCAALVDAVVRLVRLKAKAQGVELETAVETETVKGDAQLLQEALLNLVENALRYSGSDRIVIRVSADACRTVLSVTDFGVGIPSQHLPRLFERFYRVDKARSRSLGGTGLGLSIVKHIARLHGGGVSVVSTPGEKTVFSLVLPRAKSLALRRLLGSGTCGGLKNMR